LKVKFGDLALKIFTVLVFALIFGPIIVMVVFSFNNSARLGAWRGFTLKWYSALSQSGDIWQALYHSASVAGIVSVVSVVFGTLTAFVMVRYYFKGKTIMDGLLYIPLIVPEIAEALTLLLFYLWIGWGFSLGFMTVLIGHIAYDISFAFVVIRARLAGFDRSLEEAARTLGASEINTFFRVTLPILAPGIIAGGLLAFTLSYDDFYKTIFTTGPTFQTLPIVIWSMASRGGVTPELNALTTLAFGISISLALVYEWFSRK
jgi:spermidine/putrescine transport system permease protein